MKNKDSSGIVSGLPLRYPQRHFRLVVFLLSSAAFLPLPVHAAPQDGQVSAGQAQITRSNKTTTITQQSERAVIDWRGFDLSADETARFAQPSSRAVTLNRVNAATPSQIAGRIEANGNVVIINPNGVFFTETAKVDVGGLVASTADIDNRKFMSGSLQLDKAGKANAKVRNAGQITAHDAGLVGLVGPEVANSGTITATLGKVALAGGDTATLDLYGDGLVQLGVAHSSLAKAGNSGRISGQQITLSAAQGRALVDQLVSAGGELQATSANKKDGRIVLSAKGGSTTVSGQLKARQIDVEGQSIILAKTARLDASQKNGGGQIRVGGDEQGRPSDIANAQQVFVESGARLSVDALENGNAGRVIVWADDATRFWGSITAQGGAQGGDGGFVEVSGKQYLLYQGFVDTTAVKGATGLLLLDPADILIASGSGDSASDGTGTFSGSPSGVAGTVTGPDTGPSTIFESELEGIAATTNIALTATNSITVADLADNVLNLAQTAGRTVVFTAGAGGFVMADANDTLRTNGGALSIITSAAGGMTLGSLNTNGGLLTLNLAGSGTVNGSILGTGGFTKSGAGTLTLNNASARSGTTTISAGVLAVGNDGALGSGTIALSGGTLRSAGGARSFANNVSLTANSTLGGADNLVFNGTLTNTMAGNPTLTISNSGTTSFNAVNLSNSGSSRTVTFSTTGGPVTVAGTIANGGSAPGSALTKTGTGTLLLNGANTYAGATTISAGMLGVGSNTALGTGTVVLGGGTLSSEGGARALANNSSLSANSTLGGAHDLTLGGVLTHTRAGNTTLTVSNTATTSIGGLNLSNSATSRTVTLAATGGAVVVTGAVNNGGTATTSALAKTGTGTVTLAGANDYGGTTTVSAGQLTLSGSNAGAGATTLSAGVLRLENALALALGSLNLNGGALQLAGDTATNFARNVVLGAAATIVSDRLSSGAGVTHGLGTLTQGTFTLAQSAGSNVASGTAGVSFGNVTYSGNPTYNIGTAARLTLGALDNGGINRTITKTGLGALQFDSVAGSWATAGNALIINRGTVLLGADGALGAGANTNVTVNTTLAGSTSLFDLNGYNQSIGTLTFGGTGGTAATNAVATGAGLLTLGGNITLTVTGNPIANTLSGNLDLGGSDRIFTVNNSTGTARDLEISANISGTGLGLTKAGVGTLVLSGNSTYTGATMLNAGVGILRAEADNALGLGGLVLAGSTLELAGDSPISLTNNTVLMAAATIVSDRLTSGAGVTHFLGSLAQGTVALTQNAGSNVTSGAAGIAFSSAAYGGNPTYTVGAGGQLTLGALNNGGTSRTIIKNGPGNLVFAAAPAAWATVGNTLTINRGRVLLGASGALGASNNTSVNVNSTSAGSTTVFDLNGYDQTIAGLVYGGTGGTASTNAVTTGTGTLTLAGNVTFTTTGNPIANTLSGNLALGSSTRTFTIANSSGTERDLEVSAVISGTGGIIKAGTGTLVLAGANTYSGMTTLNASSGVLRAEGAAALGVGTLRLVGSTLQLAGDSALNFARNTTVTGTTTIISDRLTSGAAVTHTLGTLSLGAQTVTIGAGGNVAGGTAGVRFGNTTFTGNGGFSVGADTQLTLGALSNGSANRTVTKSGSGLLRLANAAGTWSTTGNALVINNGTVQLGVNNALGAGANTTITVNSTSAGATALLDLNNFNQTISTLTLGGTGATSSSVSNVATGTGTLTLGGALSFNATNNPLGSTISGNLALGANRIFTVADSTSAAADLTINAVISGAFSVTKAGAGTLVYGGTNTYSGATLVSAGTLALGAADRIANTSALTVSSGAAFDFAGFSETLASVTSNGSVLFGDGATITTTGAQTYNTAVTGDGVALVSSGGGAISLTDATNDITGTLAISTTGAVQVVDANDLTLGAVSGSTVFAQTGTGDLTLTGAIAASAASGTPLTLVAGGDFINNAGPAPLSVGAGARWLVYMADPTTADLGGLTADFRRFSCVYGGSCPSLGTNNGVLYASTPLLDVMPNAITITYGDGVPPLTGYTYSLSGYLGSDAGNDTVAGILTGTTAYTQGSAADNYALEHSLGALTSSLGYGFTYLDNATGIQVGKRTLNAAVQNKLLTYGQLTPALDKDLVADVVWDGFYTGDNSSSISSATFTYGSATAGSYDVVGSYDLGLSAISSGNYQLGTVTDGTLLIGKRTLTATVQDKLLTYGQLTPVLDKDISADVQWAGFHTGDDSSSISSATFTYGSATAGSYDVVGSYGLGLSAIASDNYQLGTVTGGTLQVDPYTLAVTALARNKVVGTVDPVLAYSHGALQAGNTASVFSGALERAIGEAIGTYGISQGTLSAGLNYAISFTPNVFTILAEPPPSSELPATLLATLNPAIFALTDMLAPLPAAEQALILAQSGLFAPAAAGPCEGRQQEQQECK